MDRFVSNYTLRLDAKGRVSVPAPFRAVLARDGFEGIYCYPTLGRPACSMIPEALRAARGNTSLGCIGNRVYTGLGDGELYFTIPGAALPAVVAKLETIVRANQELEHYHENRLHTIGAPPRV